MVEFNFDLENEEAEDLIDCIYCTIENNKMKILNLLNSKNDYSLIIKNLKNHNARLNIIADKIQSYDIDDVYGKNYEFV